MSKAGRRPSKQVELSPDTPSDTVPMHGHEALLPGPDTNGDVSIASIISSAHQHKVYDKWSTDSSVSIFGVRLASIWFGGESL